MASAGKAGMKFLSRWGFGEFHGVIDNTRPYVEQFFTSQGLHHEACDHHPDPSKGEWFSFTFPGISPETCLEDGQAAWHGTTLFALPSIIRQQKLVPGPAQPKGIYCHRQGTASKAQSYMMHTPIGHGLLLAPLLQLRVMNPRKIRADQWLVDDPSNCSIEKVYIRVVCMSDLEPGREWLTMPWMDRELQQGLPWD